MTVLDFNAAARRAALNGAIWKQADREPDVVIEAERLANVVERLGDVAAAFNHGHASLDDELLRLAGSVAVWLDECGQRAAA